MPNKWLSVFLAFFFRPAAFIYLSAHWWAFFYFFISIIALLADANLERRTGVSGLSTLLSIICAIHAYKLAKATKFNDGRKWFNHWWGALSIPVFLLFIIFFFRSFFYEIFQIPSLSMMPTLKSGDYIVVSKHGYGLYDSFGITVYETDLDKRKKPQRGEIFVLYPPGDRPAFVERIIGLPNDEIVFSNKQLRINGRLVDTKRMGEPHIYQETLDGNSYQVQYFHENNPYRSVRLIVPEDSYFVMGDNRDNSADSRLWGPVPAKNIVGKVVHIWN
ncbi:signal peptidase I [Alcanivorax sp. P2S70]|uniref:signal peptidase I n=1 Tax=Alcanivorax sp. P2S70 TaxID=1397527 RepID=UPI0009DF7F79|nr:signal peptidase I [Alcanivorax sp. P2S70]